MIAVDPYLYRAVVPKEEPKNTLRDPDTENSG